MKQDDLVELFAPVLRVTAKRMFGGHGVYAEGLIFAIEIDGTLYLKTDLGNRGYFEDLGSKPFTYEKKTGEQAVMAYFSLPEAAYDDEDLLKECVMQALGASRRSEAEKAAKAAKSAARPKKSPKT